MIKNPMIRNPMTRNTKKKTMQRWIVVPRIRMARHAARDRESANVKEAKVWRKLVRIDQKIVQKTAQRTVQRMKIPRILEIIVKIGIRRRIGKEIETTKDVINMNAKNANEVAPPNVVANDRQNQNVMTSIARAKNEKYQVNGAKAKVSLNNDLCVLMPEE